MKPFVTKKTILIITIPFPFKKGSLLDLEKVLYDQCVDWKYVAANIINNQLMIVATVSSTTKNLEQALAAPFRLDAAKAKMTFFVPRWGYTLAAALTNALGHQYGASDIAIEDTFGREKILSLSLPRKNIKPVETFIRNFFFE